MNLHDYGLRYGSDKATAHNYLHFYEARIGEPRSILEFGVLGGASLKMWKARYPGAKITGVDINDVKPIPGVTIHKADATKLYVARILEDEYDLILDDASHMAADMMQSFELFWPMVTTGGHYVIEDVHAVQYEQYNPNGIDFFGWVSELGIKHEYFWRDENDKSDSGTLIFYKV